MRNRMYGGVRGAGDRPYSITGSCALAAADSSTIETKGFQVEVKISDPIGYMSLVHTWSDPWPYGRDHHGSPFCRTSLRWLRETSKDIKAKVDITISVTLEHGMRDG